jgi:oligopeptide/dipeptide ABC transporter ATP-binding protein
MNKPLLEVRDLKTQFKVNQNTVYAVNGVSFDVREGEVLGIVGESGSGKSVTALSIMRLIDAQNGRIAGGQVVLHADGTARDLLSLTPSDMEQVRGNMISMIFQDPMTSLNPVLSIGFQLTEPLIIHRGMSAQAAERHAIELLDRVGIPEPHLRMKSYPHQFSGGMRQRVMVAMAVACRPKLLIADEPTTALDVTIQAQIIDLIRELKDELGTSVIIITHDLGVIAEIADQVAVMYAGIIVESGSVQQIYSAPRHPYTRALILSIPRLREWPDRLTTIEGAPPSLIGAIQGCPFEPRCNVRIPRCAVECPSLVELVPGQTAACWVAQEGEQRR